MLSEHLQVYLKNLHLSACCHAEYVPDNKRLVSYGHLHKY
jgi:hypothetical protein